MGGAPFPEPFDRRFENGLPFVGQRRRPPLRDQVPGDVLQRDSTGWDVQASHVVSFEMAVKVDVSRGISVVGPGWIAVVLPPDERRTRGVVSLEPVAIGDSLAVLAAVWIVNHPDHLLRKQGPRCSTQLQRRIVAALEALDEKEIRLPRYLDQGKPRLGERRVEDAVEVVRKPLSCAAAARGDRSDRSEGGRPARSRQDRRHQGHPPRTLP